MKTPHFLLSHPAQRDLETIFVESLHFIEVSMEQAIAYQELLLDSMEWISLNQNAGQLIIPEKGIYKWSVGSHVLIYTQQKSHVCIERIVRQNSWFIQSLVS
ncbi:MAG: type II toxin-antitoxin system RelE/ParE family toxin [Crocinitomicaceae bacterium]|nr:type II toxin-antitoxin system RelE/ParE family toxin [Crocinitomicaceae bacterium]